MAQAVARAVGAAPPGGHAFLLPSTNAAARTVRFAARHGGGRGAVLIGHASGGGPRDVEWEAPDDSAWGGGRLVDEDMGTLRRRIREARAGSSADEEEEEDDGDGSGDDGDGLLLPAAEWTELERRHRGSYVAGVREAVGLLEALLVSTRPVLGAGILALALLGVPASVFLVSAQLIRAVHAISSAALTGR